MFTFRMTSLFLVHCYFVSLECVLKYHLYVLVQIFVKPVTDDAFLSVSLIDTMAWVKYHSIGDYFFYLPNLVQYGSSFITVNCSNIDSRKMVILISFPCRIALLIACLFWDCALCLISLNSVSVIQ